MFMRRATLLFCSALTLFATPGLATDNLRIERVSPTDVTLHCDDSDPVDIFVSDTPAIPAGAQPVVSARRGNQARITMPADRHRFVIVRDGGDQSLAIIAERVVTLEQGSNFRDVGGYTAADGRSVRWGRIYRSGALPMITEQDGRSLAALGIGSIIDLRSLDERSVAPTTLDDRTGALFLSNDYSMGPLMAQFANRGDRPMYAGMETMLAPQYRQIFRRLLADDGAVMYHCSAGQDRTGVATALILSALGVDRATIITDYHLSTELRRPQWEMPPVNPADHPGNLIVQYYAQAAARPGGVRAEPLYTADGQSHLAQFFTYIDATYGGVEGYLDRVLGITAADVARLRALYLE
jgi:protein-tyrosine phosphatase